MFNNIKHYFKQLFGIYSDAEYIQLEYVAIMTMIVNAKTLTQLLDARIQITKFNENVKQLNLSPDTLHKVKLLDARWSKQYRLWKIRG